MILKEEIEKILTKEYKMVDLEALDAILTLIKKHERGMLETIAKELDVDEPCEPDCSPERHAYHEGRYKAQIIVDEYFEAKLKEVEK